MHTLAYAEARRNHYCYQASESRTLSACTAPSLHSLTCPKVMVAVLQNPALVAHALRQTLAADALSLQLKLPPAGVPAPLAHTSPDLAGGTAVVDTVAVTSVWVVQVLRALCMVSGAAVRGACQ